MFDFLKKSRAVKFLCSACLLCSLGSFAVSAGEPAKIADAYVQADLGTSSGEILLNNAKMNKEGILTKGTLMWLNEESIPTEESLSNDDEDATLTLYLVDSSKNQLAVTENLDLAQRYSDASDLSTPYDLSGTQFYAGSGTLGTSKADDAAIYSPKPGVYGVYGRVHTPGSTSLISGPTLN